MTAESIEQLKARLKREDKAKEEAFQQRLEEIKESQAPWRAEREAKEQAEEQKRRKFLDDARHKREQEMKDSAPVLARRRWNRRGARAGVASDEDPDAEGARHARRLRGQAGAAPAKPQGILVPSWWEFGEPRGLQGVRALARRSLGGCSITRRGETLTIVPLQCSCRLRLGR